MSTRLDDRLPELLHGFRVGLEELYGPRLRGTYLYGSYARGEADEESDVDVLVVLDRIEGYGAEIERTSELASRLSLHYDVSVSRAFVTEGDWRSSRTTFLRSVREEARPA